MSALIILLSILQFLQLNGVFGSPNSSTLSSSRLPQISEPHSPYPNIIVPVGARFVGTPPERKYRPRIKLYEPPHPVFRAPMSVYTDPQSANIWRTH
ncbi:MAG: hypothetical protein ABJM90_20155 [Paracoccaceae bacterium]